MRPPKDTDFFIDVENVGKFRFGRRTYGDRIRIRGEYLSIAKDFGDDDMELASMAAIAAAHSVLCVEAPKGWENLLELDLLEIPDAEDKVYRVYSALVEKENFFRSGPAKDGQTAGA